MFRLSFMTDSCVSWAYYHRQINEFIEGDLNGFIYN